MPRTNGGIIGKRNVTSFGKNEVTSITSSGTHTINSGTRFVEAIIIAGGGSGGPNASGDTGGGGGGAGGYATVSETSVSNPFPVTVGGGGNNANGSNSVAFCQTMIGGGRGAFSPINGSPGGSGGGGGFPIGRASCRERV